MKYMGRWMKRKWWNLCKVDQNDRHLLLLHGYDWYWYIDILWYLHMRQIKERSTIFLQYETLEDLLKVIVYSAQSSLGLTPMLYYINYRNQEILFILTGASGGIIINYIIQNEKPSKKFIELKRFSGEFSFVDNIGSDTQSLYIPIIKIRNSTLTFPV
jgi:hypothetical protein